MRSSVSRKTRGFTLLEIMVALAIFGIVVAAIYASWTAIVRGAETGKKSAAAVQRSRITIRTLEDALMSARSFDASRDYYYFVGENGNEATLSFVSKLAESFPRSRRFGVFDVRRLEFKLEPGDYGKQLVLRQWPVLMELDIDEKEHPLVLAKNVKAFEMRFWDDKKLDWLDEWTQTNQLPPLVEITLRWSGVDSQTYQSTATEQEIVRVVALQSVAVPSRLQIGR
jgi:general secretion pathway protein J